MRIQATKTRWEWAVLSVAAALTPVAIQAGHGHRRHGHPVKPFCNCQPVVTGQPIVVGQAAITTLQPVVRTEIRQQAQIVDVPVTTLKQVTVDEGAYQTVWVPKLTTRTVAETRLQKQVRYQSIPHQVVQHVPVLHSPAMMGHGHPAQPIIASSPIGMGTVSPQLSFESIPGAPSIAGGQSAAITPLPEPHRPVGISPTQTAAAPQAAVRPPVAQPPMAATANGNAGDSSGAWSKVPAKQASTPAGEIQQQGHQVEAETVSQEQRNQSPIAGPRPSAASVWQARGAFSATLR